ncbi:hypothetical protein KO465_03780 [Candidatus Micrarchaeota archaeon]|nr:hypothetical protein [Candidatus Micrarchaeota archaeon]
MNFEIIKKEEDYLEIKFIGEDSSIFYALRDVLAADKDVEFISVLQEHPEIENVIVILRTKKSKPIDKLKEGLKSIHKTIEDLEKSLF